jgi:hypothetical protein
LIDDALLLLLPFHFIDMTLLNSTHYVVSDYDVAMYVWECVDMNSVIAVSVLVLALFAVSITSVPSGICNGSMVDSG